MSNSDVSFISSDIHVTFVNMNSTPNYKKAYIKEKAATTATASIWKVLNFTLKIICFLYLNMLR